MAGQRTDEELLAAAVTDADALDELYRRRVAATVALAVRRCRGPEEVHDLVAAVWLEVIRAAPRFDPSRGRAMPWIFGVAANLAADRRRRAARETEALRRLGGHRVLDDEDHERLEAMIDAERAADHLWSLIERLPEGERAVHDLVVLDGLSPTEAAAALDLAPTAARMRLSRARRKLRRGTVEEAEVLT